MNDTIKKYFLVSRYGSIFCTIKELQPSTPESTLFLLFTRKEGEYLLNTLNILERFLRHCVLI